MKLTSPWTYKTPQHAARKFAAGVGTTGRQGGWIVDYRGRNIVQGWSSYTDRVLRAGYVARTDSGAGIITPKGFERIEKAKTEREAYRLKCIKQQLATIIEDAQQALVELEDGPCEASMDAVQTVEFSGQELTRLSDKIDWKC